MLARIEVGQEELVLGHARVVGRDRTQEILESFPPWRRQVSWRALAKRLHVGLQIGQVGINWILR